MRLYLPKHGTPKPTCKYRHKPMNIFLLNNDIHGPENVLNVQLMLDSGRNEQSVFLVVHSMEVLGK